MPCHGSPHTSKIDHKQNPKIHGKVGKIHAILMHEAKFSNANIISAMLKNDFLLYDSPLLYASVRAVMMIVFIVMLIIVFKFYSWVGVGLGFGSCCVWVVLLVLNTG